LGKGIQLNIRMIHEKSNNFGSSKFTSEMKWSFGVVVSWVYKNPWISKKCTNRLFVFVFVFVFVCLFVCFFFFRPVESLSSSMLTPKKRILEGKRREGEEEIDLNLTSLSSSM